MLACILSNAVKLKAPDTAHMQARVYTCSYIRILCRQCPVVSAVLPTARQMIEALNIV